MLDDIFPSEILLDLEARSKADLLALLATEASARLGISEREIQDALLAREELGSTALGKGVALPHAQLADAPRPALLIARLRRPIDFEARDGEPVDLVFLFLWPKAATKDLLGGMAEMCRVLREPVLLRKLRGAEQPADVARLLNQQLAIAGLPDDADAE